MIKKIGILFLSLMILVLGGLSLFVFVNQDVIAHELKNRLRETGLHVDFSSMDVHFLTSFPTVEASLRHVQVTNGSSTPIIEADELSIRLQTRRLLSGHVDVDEVRIKDGTIQLVKFGSGESNFTLQTTNDQEDSPSPAIHLKRLLLINTDLTYHDKNKNHLIRIEKANGTLDPNVKADETLVDVELSGHCPMLSINNLSYIKQQGVVLNTSLQIHEETWSFASAELEVGNTEVELKGRIEHINSEQPDIAFDILSATGQLTDLPNILPTDWVKTLDRHQVSGHYQLTGRIAGPIISGRPPAVRLTAEVNHTQFAHQTLHHNIQKGTGLVTLHYGGGHEGKLMVESFRGVYQGEPVEAEFQLSSFQNPKVDMCFKGKLALEDVSPDLIPDLIIHDRGHVILDSFALRSTSENLTYQGNLHLSDVAGMLHGIGFEIESGILHINDYNIRMESTQLMSMGLVHHMEGQLDVENEVYEITIESDKLDLLRLMEEWNIDQKPEVKPVALSNTNSPSVNINLEAKEIVYDHIRLDMVQAHVKYKKNQVALRSVMEYCRGVVMAEGRYLLKNGKCTFNVEAENVDIPAVFTQWDNFGQQQVQAQHLVGVGNIQSKILFTYLPGSPFNKKTLHVIGGVEIPSGELIELPLLKQFSSYVHAEDLERIKFSRLSNVFRIERGKFYLPEMFVQSSVANFILAGDQTLDNEIHYALKVNAGQILSEKIKRHDKNLRLVKARKNGFFNMHYVLKGPMDSFDYYSNKKEVLRKLEYSLHERDKILASLEQEFDIGSRYVSPLLFQEIPEMEVEDDTEPSFIPGFD